jgi:hypothetical protein
MRLTATGLDLDALDQRLKAIKAKYEIAAQEELREAVIRRHVEAMNAELKEKGMELYEP